MSNICPKCGKEYTERPAISRDGTYRDICPICGVKEAISFLPKAEQDRILAEVHKVKQG